MIISLTHVAFAIKLAFMRNFTRTIENFICEVCGAENIGDGYTNHCRKCLCSKHVDINPGDRESSCNGIMRPTNLEIKGDSKIITHQCEKCGFIRRNKASEKDDSKALIALSCGKLK